MIVALLELCRATRPTVNAIGVTSPTPGTRAQRRRDAAPGCPASLPRLRVLDDQVAGERAVDGLVDRGLGAGREHRHERDQREPDRQRRGGDQRAPGLAHRVLAREARR